MKKKLLLSIIVTTPLLAGVIIVGYWFWSDVLTKKPPLPELGSVPSFSLTSEDSGKVTRENLTGRVSIADFIFTSCAGTCPMMTAQMSDLVKNLADEPRIQFVSFSVDPETDTPAILSQYARDHHAPRGTWKFLTGDRNQIYGLTRNGFHLAVESDSADGGGILHSQKFVLVDDRAVIRGYYDSEDSVAMQSLAVDARRLAGRHE